MCACIHSSGTCCYLWLQIGWDCIFVNEAHVFLFKEMQIIFFFNWFFFLIAMLCEVTSVSGLFGPIQFLTCCQRCSCSHKRPPFLQHQLLPLPLGLEKGSLCRQGASQERGLVLVSAMCCIWNTHLPPGFASGAGFLFRLCWVGAGFGPALRLAQVEALWTPGWLEMPNSNPSITGTQIQSRA